MLAKKPAAKDRKAALALAGDEDLLAIEARELYWLPSGGISESDLDIKALDRVLARGRRGRWARRADRRQALRLAQAATARVAESLGGLR